MTQPDWTCTLRESGLFPYVLNEVALRPYPFPYRAALSFVNDGTGISDGAFEDWHAAPASRNLEVGDSLSFDPAGKIAGGERRIELAKSGYIDGISNLPEKRAGAAVSLLGKAGIQPKWYAGKQAISKVLPLAKSGVRYFSDSAWMIDKKYGDYRDYRMQVKLNDAIEQFKLYYINCADTGDLYNPLQIASRLEEAGRKQFLTEWFNKSIVRLPSSTSQNIGIFKRYRGGFEPSANSFPAQLRSLFLDRLVQYGSVLFLAQRFGEWSLVGRSAGQEARKPASAPVFDYHELGCWDDLSERFKKGMLWVAMPSRLLRWLELREALKYSSGVVDGKLVIRIHGEQISNGQCIPVSTSDLNGVAFTVPPNTPEVHVVRDWTPAAMEMKRDAEPMLSQRECIYNTWDPIIWPVQQNV